MTRAERLERLLDEMAGPLFAWRMQRNRPSRQAGRARALARIDALVRAYVAEGDALDEAREVVEGKRLRPRGPIF